MRDDGFTLAEMLVGLMLASLALSALAFAGRTAGRSEALVADQTRAGRSLDRLRARAGPAIAQGGPYESGPDRSSSLLGAPSAMRFDCGEGELCRLELANQSAAWVQAGRTIHYPLPRLRRLRLAYVSAIDGDLTDRWPPERSDRLAAVVLVSADRPVAIFRSPLQQQAGCAFELDQLNCVTGR